MHAVETMAYRGATPWHGLGKRLADDIVTAKGVMVDAGMDWGVSLEPIYLSNGTPIPGQSALIRDTDRMFLSIVGNEYVPLQNHTAFSWFDPFVQSGAAEYHTAGSLSQGKRIWILCKIKADPIAIVKNDPIERYILLSNPHQYGKACQVGFTPIRVVCQNTLSMAIADAESRLIGIRHNAYMLDNLIDIRETMAIADNDFRMTADKFKVLAKRGVDSAKLREYFKQVLEVDDTTNSRIIPELMQLLETGRGSDIKGVRGTLWGGYNAVTEWLSWRTGRNSDNRLNSLWYGKGKDINIRALQIALAA